MQLLGLARRAGAVAPGTDAVRHAIRAGRAHVVLLAGDASPVQLDKIARTMNECSIPTAHVENRETLGAAVGLAPLSAVAVTNASLAEELVVELGDLLVDDSVAVER
ncbi:MAG: ribosomal L7Ae/L30e/S12e/Gadd45 family protein [Gemmatimonadota bacterium]|jgi:ribosomal protein L7Ae-like RNA K-turn-binding protein